MAFGNGRFFLKIIFIQLAFNICGYLSEIICEPSRRLITVFWAFCHRSGDDMLAGRRQPWLHFPYIRDGFENMFDRQTNWGICLVGMLPCEHFKEDNAEGIDVRTAV